MSKIILYSTHCPRCQMLEKQLQQNNITYETITDVELMTAKGFTEAPHLEVNGQIMSFNEAKTWIKEHYNNEK